MVSGAIIQHFLFEKGITPFEDKSFQWVVEDGAGIAIPNMAGWSVSFWWLPHGVNAQVDGPVALDAVAVFQRFAALDAPNANVPMSVADWTTYSIVAGMHSYELWRVDFGNQRRLAHGDIQVIG